MSLIKKSLLFLFIYILHVNHAIVLKGSLDYYRKHLNFKVKDIEDLENAFSDEYNRLGNEADEHFGNEFKNCREKFPDAIAYFETFTNISTKAINNICNFKNYVFRIIYFKSRCYSNIKKYLFKYLETLIMDQTNKCLNSKNTNTFGKKKLLNEINSEGIVTRDELDEEESKLNEILSSLYEKKRNSNEEKLKLNKQNSESYEVNSNDDIINESEIIANLDDNNFHM
ncbi:uncharacterized protein LOC127286520 [Leptopilina boulardi]|uniref:uncharacterized protein LOC127286520 n=1 Tax=Leptopilina boulardi TaxID=63433 RepID=UPI0021F5F4FB|nr:uncharacterized protein LOC127286520 [Leptopilina boulardi]